MSATLTWNRKAFCIPATNGCGEVAKLTKRIAALPLLVNEDGCTKLGPISQLGPDALVEVCGEGYNEQTVKVRLHQSYFFIFREDLN